MRRPIDCAPPLGVLARPIVSALSIVMLGLAAATLVARRCRRASRRSTSNSWPISAGGPAASTSAAPFSTCWIVDAPTGLASSCVTAVVFSTNEATRSSTASSRPSATCSSGAVDAGIDEDEIEAIADQPARADEAIARQAESEVRTRAADRRVAGDDRERRPEQDAAGVDARRADLPSSNEARPPAFTVSARCAWSIAGRPARSPTTRTASGAGVTPSVKPPATTRSSPALRSRARAARQQRRDRLGDAIERGGEQRRQARRERRRRVGGPRLQGGRLEVATAAQAPTRRRGGRRASRRRP